MKIRSSITVGFLFVAVAFVSVLGLSLYSNVLLEKQSHRQLRAVRVLQAWETLAHRTTRVLSDSDPLQAVARWDNSINAFRLQLDSLHQSMHTENAGPTSVPHDIVDVLMNHWNVVKGDIEMIRRNLDASKPLLRTSPDSARLSILEIYQTLVSQDALGPGLYMATYDIRRFTVFSAPFRKLIDDLIVRINAEAELAKKRLRLFTYLFSGCIIVAALMFLAAVGTAEHKELWGRLITSNISDVAWTMTPQKRITFVSPSVMEVRGFTPEEVRSMPLRDTFAPESYEEFDRVINDELVRRQGKDRSASSTRTVQCEENCKDGSTMWAELKATFLRNSKGQVTEIIGVTRDITQRRAMDRALLERERLESLGILAGGIAHDFNNLLTAISGNVSLLKLLRAGRDPEEESSLGDIEKALLRARDLTQQLLTFSKGGAPVKKVCDISATVEESARFVLHGATHSLRLDMASDLWPVEVDLGQISQVIGNLVINAAQAMPDGGTVTIRAHNQKAVSPLSASAAAGRYICLEVVDTGIGIPRENQGKIFDPFFTTKAKGSGLGLASAYSIVKAHGGLLSVKSEPGQGSCFQLLLPAVEREFQEPGEVVRPAKAMATRILVMDDENEIRSMLCKLLTMAGHTVCAVADGALAVEKFRQVLGGKEQFGLVILDLTVPGGMGGKETLKHLVALDPYVKVVASSGYSTDPIISQHKEYGFAGVLIKPYTLHALNDCINKVLSA